MRSTFTGLNTMVKGIFSNQLSLDTVGHNITNANTEGYSRQSVNLAATRCQMQPTIYGDQAVGTGVDSTSILRARDIFADKQYRIEVATQQYNDVMQRAYENIETTFYDVQDTGIQNAIQEFWNGLQDLSTNASDDTTRKNLVNKGVNLANVIQSAKDDLVSHIDLLYDDFEMRVDNVNEMTAKIAHLNKDIVTMEANGSSANDLRDQRDLLVDQLAELVDVTTYENWDGSYTVVSNGVTLVNSGDVLTLDYTTGQSSHVSEVNYGMTNYCAIVKETGLVFVPKNGGIRGIIDAIQENKDFIDELAQISAMLLTTFNDQHRAGYDMNGDLGMNFFGAYENSYSQYSYGEFRYNVNSTNADYFYVYNGDKILTGVDIIDELQVNTNITATGGTQYIAAKTDMDLTGKSVSSTALGDNAVLLSNLFNMNKDYTESTSDAVKDKYYFYQDRSDAYGRAKTIKIYDDLTTYTTVTGTTYTTVISREVVYQGQTGVVYRQVTTVINNTDESAEDVSTVKFVDQHGYTLNYSIDEDSGAVTYTTTVSSKTFSYTSDSPGILIYSDDDGGLIYKSIDSEGNVTYTDGNGETLTKSIDKSNADYAFIVTFTGESNSYTIYASSNEIRALGDSGIFDYYDYSMSRLGLRAESMDLKVESQDELIVQIENWRSSTAGVDWNEELTNMIKFQKGYGACARCLTTMDEMLDRLVNNTGQVGR